MPEGVKDDILKGMYRLREVGSGDGKRVRLLGSGTILREVEAAAEMLHERYGITSEVFSVTSFTELSRDAQDCARWNLLHPDEPPRVGHAARLLAGDAPVIVASDYIKSLAEQLRGSITGPYHVLGTDGFGRSDTREELRHFFEVDRRFVALAALKTLADQQKIGVDVVRKARDELNIDPEKPNPRLV
jgi:pyruvate dehydrogenase E1 component